MYTICEQQASEACEADVHGMKAVWARLKTCEALGGRREKGYFMVLQYRSKVSWQSKLETRSSKFSISPSSSFEARVSSFEFGASSFEFRVSSFEFRASSFQLRVSEFRVSSFETLKESFDKTIYLSNTEQWLRTTAFSHGFAQVYIVFLIKSGANV